MAAFPMTTALPGAPVKALDEFTSDLVAARVTVAHLARWARRYVVSHGAGDGCCCSGPLCALETLPGGRDACRLARELAWLPVAEAGEHHRTGGKPDEVALHYVSALRGASGAVFYCQRVQHLMGECWFTTPELPGEGLCARTLAIADRMGGTRRDLA